VQATNIARGVRMTTDWREWHTPYADPTSSLSRRLAVVQESLAAALYRAPGGGCVSSARARARDTT
jgi:hypothetical protein